MVDFIDIHKLNLEELSGVVAIYPWYGGARMELCSRMSQMGAISQSQIEETALHIGSRTILKRVVNPERKADLSDRDARKLMDSYMPAPQKKEQPKIHVVGGDYFSQSEYNGVRREDDGIFSAFARSSRDTAPQDTPEEGAFTDFCTETLAKIYLDQGYREQAVEIYSKLSLRYPEKSVYFAALIDEINKNK